MQADTYLTPSFHAVQAEYLSSSSEEALLFCERTPIADDEPGQDGELFIIGANKAFKKLIHPMEAGRSLAQAWPELAERLPTFHVGHRALDAGQQYRFEACWFAEPARLLSITVHGLSVCHLVLVVKDESTTAHLQNRLDTLQEELEQCRLESARSLALLTDNVERYLQTAAARQRECLEAAELALAPEDETAGEAIAQLYQLSTHLIRFSMAHRLDFKRTLVDLPALIRSVMKRYHSEAPRLTLDPRGIMQVMTAAAPMEALIQNMLQAILHNTAETLPINLICEMHESFVDTNLLLSLQAPDQSALKALHDTLTAGDLEFLLSRHLAQLLGGELVMTYAEDKEALTFEVYLNQD